MSRRHHLNWQYPNKNNNYLSLLYSKNFLLNLNIYPPTESLSFFFLVGFFLLILGAGHYFVRVVSHEGNYKCSSIFFFLFLVHFFQRLIIIISVSCQTLAECTYFLVERCVTSVIPIKRWKFSSSYRCYILYRVRTKICWVRNLCSNGPWREIFAISRCRLSNPQNSPLN